MPYIDPGEASLKLAEAISDLAKAIEHYAAVEHSRWDYVRTQAETMQQFDHLVASHPRPRRPDWRDFAPPSDRPR